jgi:hypothetical protein
MPRLTVGYRCRIKPDSPWGKGWHNCANREVLLKERSGGEFSLLILKEGKNIPLDKHYETVDSEVAWVEEEAMELVDKDVNTNLTFIDWYEEACEDFCPDCGYWDEEASLGWQEKVKTKWHNGEDYICPKCGCVVG